MVISNEDNPSCAMILRGSSWKDSTLIPKKMFKRMPQTKRKESNCVGRNGIGRDRHCPFYHLRVYVLHQINLINQYISSFTKLVFQLLSPKWPREEQTWKQYYMIVVGDLPDTAVYWGHSG